MIRLMLMFLLLSRLAPTDGDAGRGEQTFDRICAECHSAQASMRRVTSPDRTEVESRLRSFLPLHRDITEAQLADLIAYLLQIPAD